MTVDDITAGKHTRLQNAFEAVFFATLAHADAAMFGNRKIEQDYTYWFSPRAARLFSSVLDAFHASESFAPPRDSVMLLVGHAYAMNLLAAR